MDLYHAMSFLYVRIKLDSDMRKTKMVMLILTYLEDLVEDTRE